MKIGRPAVPALIEHLSDRRVTRSVGGGGMSNASLHVLRVQDIVLACIERILDLPFYRRYSTSSYFSTDTEAGRKQVIAEIRAWWEKNGAKSPVDGFVAFLDGHPGDLDTLRKIEAIDPKAVDSRAIIKKWAVDLDAGLLPRLARALAERGDLALIDALRRQRLPPGHTAPEEYVWTLLRYGNAEDFRYLRASARKSLEAGGGFGTSGFFSSVASGVTDSRNPLAVPILVDLLDQRSITGSRNVDNGKGSVGTSLADRCLEALIRLTGHTEDYVATDPDAKRLAAIDHWFAWWTNEGKAAFLKAHPEVAPVWGDPEERLREVSAAALPPLASVAAAEPRFPVTYDVPRDQAAALVKSGQVEAVRGADGRPALRFPSAEAAARWFDTAQRTAAPPPAAAEPSLVRIFTGGSNAPPCTGPDGRVWVWRTTWDRSVEEVMREVEAQAGQEMPQVEGARGVLVDSRGRVWIVPDKQNTLLLGYDPKTRQWIRRPGLPEGERFGYNDKEQSTATYCFAGTGFESRSGLLFFPDRLGLHILDADRWSYQPLYEKPLREENWQGKVKAFTEPSFREDAAGKVYVWSSGNASHWSGTRGYWVFDGRRWENAEPGTPEAYDVTRKGDEVRLFAGSDRLEIRKDGRAITGEEARRVLSPNLRFNSASLLATTSDGNTCLYLNDVTVPDPISKDRCRVAVLPPEGPLQLVPPNVEAAFLRGANHRRLAGPGGWIWQTDGHVVEAVRPAGPAFRTFDETARLTHIQLLAIDGRGQLVLIGSGQTWRFRPTPDAAAEHLAATPMPAMRVPVRHLAIPDALGRMWCDFDAPGAPLMIYDGAAWRSAGDTSRGEERSEFISAFAGAKGAMVLEDSGYGLHLIDGEGHVAAASAEALASRHGDRLRAALAWPPGPAVDFYHRLFKDPRGRIWWAKWENAWGVIDGDKAISGKDADIALGPNRGTNFSVFAPVGDAGRAFICDGWSNRGSGAVVEVADGRLVKVADVAIMPDFIASHGWGRGVVRDAKGRLWVAIFSDKSVAVTDEGRIAASHAGRVLLADRQGGLWFAEWTADRAACTLVRVAPDGTEARLGLAALSAESPLAEAPDGTAWALTATSILRVRAGERLEVVEEHPARVFYSDSIWCDPKGCVWHLQHTGETPSLLLLRYATAATAVAGGR